MPAGSGWRRGCGDPVAMVAEALAGRHRQVVARARPVVAWRARGRTLRASGAATLVRFVRKLAMGWGVRMVAAREVLIELGSEVERTC